MALLADSLSVWEIAFRWAGRNPRDLCLRIPVDVQDHFRNMMDAILSAELPCESILLEKRKFEDFEKRFSIYFWLDDIYDCIHGHDINRKLMRHAEIGRYDFKLWCERRTIPLPDFWFPPGWNLEYNLPDGDIHPGHYYVRRDWTREDWEQWHKEQAESATAKEGASGGQADGESFQSDAECTEGEPVSGSASAQSDESKEEQAAEKLRPSQSARIACQQIASVIWKDDSERTIASVVRDDLIQKYGGGSYFADSTVTDWVKQVAPPHVRARRGRPKKGTEGE